MVKSPEDKAAEKAAKEKAAAEKAALEEVTAESLHTQIDVTEISNPPLMKKLLHNIIDYIEE